MTVLFLAANPVDMEYRLRLDKEYREISDRMRAGTYRDSINLACEWSVRASDLNQAMLAHNPQVVHFSGHGTRSNGIVLEDDFGKARPVDRQALARLFKEFKNNIGLVVLNACYSEDQASWLKEIVDYTIGMSATIRDHAAITFSAALYEALSFGRTVSSAFELALIKLELLRIPGPDRPRLIVRDGVDESLPLFAPLKGRAGAIDNQRDYLEGRVKSVAEGSPIEQAINVRGSSNVTLTSARDIGALSITQQGFDDLEGRGTESGKGQPQAEAAQNPELEE